MLLYAHSVPLRFIPDIHRATHRIGLFIASSTLQVSQAEAHILAHLFAHGDSTIAELHHAFGHKRSTLTSILDRLTERGLITRETSEYDRRSFVISLTVTGKKLSKRVHDELENFESQVIKNLTKAELRTLKSALDKITIDNSEKT